MDWWQVVLMVLAFFTLFVVVGRLMSNQYVSTPDLRVLVIAALIGCTCVVLLTGNILLGTGLELILGVWFLITRPDIERTLPLTPHMRLCWTGESFGEKFTLDIGLRTQLAVVGINTTGMIQLLPMERGNTPFRGMVTIHPEEYTTRYFVRI